jgi:NACHT domain
MQWIQAIEESEDVLWLYGSAGAGKSAIAQTIAEMCDELGLIIASFFFSRASQSRNHEKRLISSIAYQLAISIPATRFYIESAVQIDPAIFDKSLETQIKKLIIRPLQNACDDVSLAVAKQWPRLIIIDGLDECNGPAIQCSIIRLLSKALRHVPVPLILFVASRPEPHIRNTFNLMIKSVSRHIVLDDSYESDADIKELLVSGFKEIKENHHLGTYIPKSWPSEAVINRLVRTSSGQFIYASTVMKYLNSPKHRPMKQLDIILGLTPVIGDMPYKELDALYSHILSCVEDIATTLKILSFLFFGYRYFRGITPDFVATLFGLDEEDVYLHLSELHSVLYVPPPPNASRLQIRPTHASLQDFLVDKLRSGKYYLDEEAFHTDLAQQCVRQISTLSMKRPLHGLSSLEEYLTHGFIHHCTHAAPDSADLKNDLMQLCDLGPWLDIVRPDDIPDSKSLYSAARDLPSLFAWLYKVCQG